ncbi:MAG: flagellar assembly protein FliW [Bryobacteraceae bacterium]
MTIHLEFPHGLPAFETHKRFRLIESRKREPLLFLESETNPKLSFLLLPVAMIDADYRLALSAEDGEALGTCGASPLVCLAVITAAEDLPPTANLLAPVVVNLDSGKAVQAVRSDAVYSHKHPLVPGGALCS